MSLSVSAAVSFRWLASALSACGARLLLGRCLGADGQVLGLLDDAVLHHLVVPPREVAEILGAGDAGQTAGLRGKVVGHS